MKKTLIIALICCAFPFFAMAQDKIGVVNRADIFQLMPELTTIKKTLDDKQAQWENVLSQSRDEYNAKIKDFQDKQDAMSESIKAVKQSELADMEQRMNTTYQNAQADLQKAQQDLQQPVIDKMNKAINEVAAENGYTYILDSQAVIYQSPKANDITALVKKKLGIN